MAIYINGEKQPSKELSYDDFIKKVENMVSAKGYAIHRDSNLDRTLRSAFEKEDYQMAVEAYECNAMYWGGACN